MNIYRLRATALCPVDESRDHYDVEVRSEHTIYAERLRGFFEDRANDTISQEQLTLDAQDALDAIVTLTGEHPSPVTITSGGEA